MNASANCTQYELRFLHKMIQKMNHFGAQKNWGKFCAAFACINGWQWDWMVNNVNFINGKK